MLTGSSSSEQSSVAASSSLSPTARHCVGDSQSYTDDSDSDFTTTRPGSGSRTSPSQGRRPLEDDDDEDEEGPPSDPVSGDASDSESDRDEVILSVYWRNGKLGAASYSLQNPVIYVLNDVVDDWLLGFKVLQSLFLQIQPTQVVTCKTLQQRFLFLLNNLLMGEMESSDQTLHGNLHLLPDAEFKDWSEEEHKQYIRARIDTNQDAMINALARLLKYMNSNLSWLCLSHQQNPILGIRNLCIDQQVWISNETYRALQIFTHTAHPSLFKWTSEAFKEGLSIFGLFNRCSSKLGSKYMRAMMLQPTSNIQEIKKRHEVITFFLNPAHEDVVKKMQGCIRNVQSITGMLPRLFAAQATIAQWKSLKKTNHNVLLLRELCSQFGDNVPFFEKARSIISEDLYQVGQLMDKIIDIEASEQMKRFTVMHGVDTDLDKNLPQHIEECSVMFLPEIGFLVSVPMWKENPTMEEMHVPGFKFKFIANKMIHYKSRRCQELDSSLGDIYLRIGRLELHIMLKLVQYIQKHIDSLIDSLSYVGELDCLIAFADVAREFGYVKPVMTSSQEIFIEKGRHPLQECCVSNYVPNDTFSSRRHSLIKILSGPNASGKSVYLKQTAVIAYLAHTGSFIPAKQAEIGVLDQIHTRIQTTESAASQLSAFLIDLRQMNTAVSMSTRSSLLVVDEFGKGTSEVDGLSLLSAFLTHLVQRGPSNCPHVILSTHFHRLADMMGNTSLIKTLVLEHMISNGELVYLFELKPGQIRTSLAIEVAKANGIPDSEIKRSNEVLRALRGGTQVNPTNNHKKMRLSKEEDAYLKNLVSEESRDQFDIELLKKIVTDNRKSNGS